MRASPGAPAATPQVLVDLLTEIPFLPKSVTLSIQNRGLPIAPEIEWGYSTDILCMPDEAVHPKIGRELFSSLCFLVIGRECGSTTGAWICLSRGSATHQCERN